MVQNTTKLNEEIERPQYSSKMYPNTSPTKKLGPETDPKSDMFCSPCWWLIAGLIALGLLALALLFGLGVIGGNNTAAASQGGNASSVSGAGITTNTGGSGTTSSTNIGGSGTSSSTNTTGSTATNTANTGTTNTASGSSSGTTSGTATGTTGVSPVPYVSPTTSTSPTAVSGTAT